MRLMPLGTGDCRIVAINAATGSKVWDTTVFDADQTGITEAPRVGNGSVKLLVLLTKSDKLNRSEAAAALAGAQALLGEIATDESDVRVELFSALKKQGVEDAGKVLYDWVHP